MSLRKSLVGQHVVFSAKHQLGELGMAWLEGLDQLGPVLFGSGQNLVVDVVG